MTVRSALAASTTVAAPTVLADEGGVQFLAAASITLTRRRTP
jgi:hypothetical protein